MRSEINNPKALMIITLLRFPFCALISFLIGRGTIKISLESKFSRF